MAINNDCFKRAKEHYINQELEKAIELFNMCLDKNLDNLELSFSILHELGHIYKILKVYDKSIECINRAVELTKDNTGMTFGFAFNYGGRMEILDVVHRIVADGIPVQNIDEGLFTSYLYTAGLPDVDLLIRTGGELRISNFLLWQAAYSEYYFTDILWPDFNQKELEKALLAYSQRQRRFGKL